MGCGSSKSVPATVTSQPQTAPGYVYAELSEAPLEPFISVETLESTLDPTLEARSKPESDRKPTLQLESDAAQLAPSIQVIPSVNMKRSEHAGEVSDSAGDQLYGRSVSKESTTSVSSTTDLEKKRKHIKYAISKEETSVVLERLDLCFRRLRETSDYDSEESHKDLEYIRCTSRLPLNVVRFSDEDRRPIFAQKMADSNICDVFMKIWKYCFRPAFLESDMAHYYALKNITITLWNATDYHDALCNKVLETELHLANLRYLDDPIFSENHQSDQKIYLIKGLFGIITNILQRGGLCRQQLRNHNAVRITQRYQDSENTMLQCKVAIILAYLIDEHENEMINSDDKNIVFIIKILKSSLQNPDHVSRFYGYKASEIIHALNLLSANESNKMRIVDNGALPYYIQLMKMDGSASEKEQELAAEGIWSLAFTCGEDLLKEPGLVQALETLVAESENKSVQTQAKGALWILHGENLAQAKSHSMKSARMERRRSLQKDQEEVGSAVGMSKPRIQADSDSDDANDDDDEEGKEDDEDLPHIMISYQWGVQATMLHVRDQLKDAGYKVWMDVDEMSGSILEAMAHAVEKSALVIVCMSQKYKESPNCRTEAEYAYRLHKPIIPLRLEYRYMADGWLGALVGNKLYFDLSQEEKYEKSINSLIKELGPRGKRSRGGGDGKGLQPAKEKPTTIKPILTSPVTIKATTATSSYASPPSSSSSGEPHGTVRQPEKTVRRGPRGDAEDGSKAGPISESDVRAWFDKQNLEKEKHQFSGFDGSLLKELGEMLKDAPEFFYTYLRDDMHMSLLSILKLTKALKQL